MAENQLTPADQQALNDFWTKTQLPMSQVRENLNPDNGQYDLCVLKLDPCLDDKKKVYIQGEFQFLAPAAAASAKFNTWKRRFYIGTDDDLMGTRPETLLNCRALSTLKSIARVCQVPCNNQLPAELCKALIGKTFSARIETTKSKKDGKEYCDFGRNFSAIGVIPAQLDTQAAAVTPPTPSGNGGPVLDSSQFGSE